MAFRCLERLSFAVLYKAIVLGVSSSVVCLFDILGVDASDELRNLFLPVLAVSITMNWILIPLW